MIIEQDYSFDQPTYPPLSHSMKEIDDQESSPDTHLDVKTRITIILTILSALVCLVSSQMLRSVHPTFSLNRELLEMPSSYVGFEHISRKSETPRLPFQNYPYTVAHVRWDNSPHVLPSDRFHNMTTEGTVAPDNRHILVTQELSTIVQFRIQDYGMNLCSLSIFFPLPGNLQKETPQYDSPTASINVNDTSQPIATEIKVRRLNSSPTSHFLDLWSLPWDSNTMLSRMLPPEALEIVQGRKVSTAQFPCPQGSLQIFELNCARGPCSLDFWQDPERSNQHAVVLTQYPSLQL